MFSAVVKDAAFAEKVLALQAFEPVGDTPEAFAAFIQADRNIARRVVQTTGIKMDEGMTK